MPDSDEVRAAQRNDAMRQKAVIERHVSAH